MSQPVRPETPETPAETPAPVVVKKYANRRLYNTESSSYITLDNLAQMIRAGRDFVVYDAKSGEDITRSVLTQIIVEEESKGRALLPTGFLRQLISFYGDSLQNLVPRYLEQSMSLFARQQEQMRLAMQQSVGNFFPFNMEEVGRQNMAIMERAMNLFAPFYRRPGAAEPRPEAEEEAAARQQIAALQAEVEQLRRQVAEARAGANGAGPESAAEGAPAGRKGPKIAPT
ncbi:MAG: polyhydroxyalkanoate synthesis repressor PhaR [Alphaproteobacteria bacterium]|nr:polyhydroxyalkanoate synthesis repressor PhaR [Alphaproteobacteria bacterium]